MANTWIIGREGNQRIPITDKFVSRKHCKIIDNGNGTFIVENKSPNGTLVDGKEIIKTTATLDSVLQLGPQFKATLRQLLGVTKTPPPDPSPAKDVPTFSISHLRRIWEEYNRRNIEIANAQRKINQIRAGMGIFTMCAMPTILFLGPLGYVLIGVGVVGNIYCFWGMKNAETPEERQARQERFEELWVCPNPSCRRSLPSPNYRHLVRNYKNCPHCKCKYVET